MYSSSCMCYNTSVSCVLAEQDVVVQVIPVQSGGRKGEEGKEGGGSGRGERGRGGEEEEPPKKKAKVMLLQVRKKGEHTPTANTYMYMGS